MMRMHPSSTTSTPFSVKDILKLDYHQNEYENDLPMMDQVVPMRQHQLMRAASKSDGFYDAQSERCVYGMQEKIAVHRSAAEEEMNEKGEINRTVTNNNDFFLKMHLWFVWFHIPAYPHCFIFSLF